VTDHLPILEQVGNRIRLTEFGRKHLEVWGKKREVPKVGTLKRLLLRIIPRVDK
jgi:hypothetical protein